MVNSEQHYIFLNQVNDNSSEFDKNFWVLDGQEIIMFQVAGHFKLRELSALFYVLNNQKLDWI